jgi:hypothetical protein
VRPLGVADAAAPEVIRPRAATEDGVTR